MLSVTGPAQANQMIENDNDDTQAALYWRQGLNVLTNELSTVKTVCSCAKSGNLDMTPSSLDARKKLWEMATPKLRNPRNPDETVRATRRETSHMYPQEETEEVRPPLSLTGPGATSAQQLTDVKAGGVGVRAQE